MAYVICTRDFILSFIGSKDESVTQEALFLLLHADKVVPQGQICDTLER